MTDAAIERIARLDAGDARLAIALLRQAAKHVSAAGVAELTADVVRDRHGQVRPETVTLEAEQHQLQP